MNFIAKTVLSIVAITDWESVGKSEKATIPTTPLQRCIPHAVKPFITNPQHFATNPTKDHAKDTQKTRNARHKYHDTIFATNFPG